MIDVSSPINRTHYLSARVTRWYMGLPGLEDPTVLPELMGLGAGNGIIASSGALPPWNYKPGGRIPWLDFVGAISNVDCQSGFTTASTDSTIAGTFEIVDVEATIGTLIATRVTGDATARLIFSLDTAGTNTMRAWMRTDGGGTSDRAVQFNLSAPDGTVIHWCVTYTHADTTMSLYVDGALRDTSSSDEGSSSPTNNKSIIGDRSTTTSAPFGSNLRETMILDGYAASAPEVWSLYIEAANDFPTMLNWESPMPFFIPVVAATRRIFLVS